MRNICRYILKFPQKCCIENNVQKKAHQLYMQHLFEGNYHWWKATVSVSKKGVGGGIRNLLQTDLQDPTVSYGPNFSCLFMTQVQSA